MCIQRKYLRKINFDINLNNVNLLFFCTKNKVNETYLKSLKKHVALYRDLNVKVYAVYLYIYIFTDLTNLRHHQMCLHINEAYGSGVWKHPTQ
jgi:hypothetical protein